MKENINFNKLESIQMCNFLMKKEITTKLIEDTNLNNQTQKQKQKYNFINIFIEDLFNIINQQILTYAQIYESIEEEKIENLIINNKTISFNMIINFFNKIFSLLNKEKIKNNNLSRNYEPNKLSCIQKINNYKDKNNSYITNVKNNFKDNLHNTNNYEEIYQKRKYKTNINSIHNSIQSSQKNSNKNSRKNSYNNLKDYLLNNNSYSSKNLYTHKTNKSNNIKPYYINLNKLNENDGKDIEIFIKSQKTKKYEYDPISAGRKEKVELEKKDSKKNFIGNNNYNNHIIFIKQIYKGCNPSSNKKYKDYINNEKKKRNSFNKKIKDNKINIENSKIYLKDIKIKNEKENNINNMIINKNIKNYKPFKPRNNNKYSPISKIDIHTDINNNINKNIGCNKYFENLTQRFEKRNYDNNDNKDNININKNEIKKNQNTFSEKILYNFDDNEIIKKNNNIKCLSNSYNSNCTDNNLDKTDIVEDKTNHFISPYSFDPNQSSLNNNSKNDFNEKDNFDNFSFNNKDI